VGVVEIICVKLGAIVDGIIVCLIGAVDGVSVVGFSVGVIVINSLGLHVG
jgi:hypothetical protein